MSPDFAHECAKKLANDETVWMVNEPASGCGKPRPAMVTCAYVDPVENGRIHLDFGPYGRWPDEQVPQWALDACGEPVVNRQRTDSHPRRVGPDHIASQEEAMMTKERRTSVVLHARPSTETCEHCNGDGSSWVVLGFSDDAEWRECEWCHGTGRELIPIPVHPETRKP